MSPKYNGNRSNAPLLYYTFIIYYWMISYIHNEFPSSFLQTPLRSSHAAPSEICVLLFSLLTMDSTWFFQCENGHRGIYWSNDNPNLCESLPVYIGTLMDWQPTCLQTDEHLLKMQYPIEIIPL